MHQDNIQGSEEKAATVNTGVYLTTDQRKWLRRKKTYTGENFSTIIRGLIREKMEEEEAKSRQPN